MDLRPVDEKVFAKNSSIKAKIFSVTDQVPLEFRKSLGSSKLKVYSTQDENYFVPEHFSFEGTSKELQYQCFLHTLSSFKDVWMSNIGSSNRDVVTKCLVHHALGHVLNSLKTIDEHDGMIESGNEIGNVQDQGFAQPKVLILAPFRNRAYQFVTKMLEVCSSEGRVPVSHRSRFEKEFGPVNMDEEERKRISRKPKDYQEMFSGNTDDCFRIGMSFKKRSVKLYSDFHQSDIIIASPLGLKMAIGVEGENDFDIDFLSSIEVCILDSAEVFNMQNFDHLEFVFKHLNSIPKKAREIDFSRVREIFLNDWGSHYRQTVICSSYPSNDLNVLFKRDCQNLKGKMKFQLSYSDTVSKIIPNVRHLFRRFDVNSPAEIDSSRFEFFTTQVS